VYAAAVITFIASWVRATDQQVGAMLRRRWPLAVTLGPYHAGYSDFRSDKMVKPLTGDVIWSVPTLVTLNPIGSVISHAGLHATAVLHSYDTDTFLPPRR